MRASTNSDKLRDFLYELQDNPAIQALGLMPIEGMNPSAAATVFHGTGAPKFDKFKREAIGSGEGAQAYGYGHYFAGNVKVARDYFDALKKRFGGGLNFKGAKINLEEALANQNKIPGANSGARGIGTLPPSNSNLGRVRNRLSVLEDLSEYPDEANIIDRISRYREDTKDYLDRLKAAPFMPWQESARMGAIKGREELLSYLDKIAPHLEQTPQTIQGGIIKAEIPDEAIARMLKWDAPMNEQPEQVKNFASRFPRVDEDIRFLGRAKFGGNGVPGSSLYNEVFPEALGMSTSHRSRPSVSAELEKAGVPGVSYLNGMNRAKGVSSNPEDYNYVSFSDDLPKILDYWDFPKLKGLGLLR
jgi:hypothetical protein